MESSFMQYIKNVDIFYKNRKLSLNSIDDIIINLINDTFNYDKNKNNLVITLEEEITIVYMLVIIGISLYYKNMKNSESNILDILQKDDKVCYKRNIYTFEGFNNINNNKYIKLRGKKDVITNIPIKNAYELTLYNGESTRINKSKNLSNNTKTNLTKLLISQMMKEDICNLNGVIEESSLIVVKGKEKFLEILENIEIVVNKERVPFTELFCSAYWSSGDGEASIIKNTIKEDIIFNITTNTSTALDLIMNDDKIKNVIVIGEKTYRDYLETDLRRISFFPGVKKILLIDTWQSNDNYEYFINQDSNYEIKAITKDTILDNVNLYYDKEFESQSMLQVLHYKVAKNLVNKSVKITYVKDSIEFNNNIKKISILLKQLCIYADSSDYVLRFIKRAYSLRNKIETTIIPLKYCTENEKRIIFSIERLKEIKSNFHETRSEYELMDQIIILFNEIIDELKHENKKFLSIKYIRNCKEKTLLLLKNKEEINSINRYLAINRMNNIKAMLFNKDINFINYDVIILPFYYENINIIKSLYINDLHIVGYNRELTRYKCLINKYNNMVKSISGSNGVEIHYRYLDNLSNFNKGYTEEESIEIDTYIKEILDNSFIRLIIAKEDEFESRQSTHSKAIAKKLVVFKDGKYIFLSENYMCNYLSKSEANICTKSINEIEIEDKLIFVVNEKSGKGDIVKNTIEKLLNYKEFKDLYGEYFEKNMYWKKCLIEYMKKNSLDEKDVANIFSVHGQTITAIAITNWLNGNIIGPQNSNNLKIIAEIIDDKNLKSEIDSVIISCKQVRSIQIKIRKAIAKKIIASVISNDIDDNDIYKLINNAIGDFENYAYVGEVEYIKSIEKEIGVQYINRVNEGDEY